MIPGADALQRWDIFLDRDGVINANRDDHVKSWHEFHFLPGALEGLRLLTEYGYRIFIVTNQAAINRGLLAPATLEQIHQRMVQTAAAHGAAIAGIRYCPHRPDEACGCRKPQPGMLLSLAAEHGIDLEQTYLVGDACSDIAAGQAAGCRTVLVLSGRTPRESPDFWRTRPDHVAEDLLEAARWLCAQPVTRTPQPARADGGLLLPDRHCQTQPREQIVLQRDLV